MPQLVKGGKWVFGWATVGQDLKVKIPEQAYLEYGFKAGEKVVFTKGSRSSGGFGIGHEEVVRSSEAMKTRIFDSTEIDQNMRIRVPEILGMDTGMRLLVCRGSCYALGFLKQGPIIDEAIKHPAIEIF